MLSNTSLAVRKPDSSHTDMSRSWLIDMLARRFRPQRCNQAVAHYGQSFIEELAAEVERKLLSERIPERIQHKMETLAMLKVKMHRLDEAERIYAELLFRKIEIVGRCHPAIIDDLLPLARVCELQGKTQVADELLELARQIRETWDRKMAPDQPAKLPDLFVAPPVPACQFVV